MLGPEHVVAKKHGLELGFKHVVLNEKYPLVKKSKNSYVPYLAIVWFQEKFREPLPFGVRFGISTEEVTARMGFAPTEVGKPDRRSPSWSAQLDPSLDVLFTVNLGSVGKAQLEKTADGRRVRMCSC